MRNIKNITIILLQLFIFHFSSGQSIVRVEPPNWWIGMKDPNLQLMIYGPGVGTLEAAVDHEGVVLVKSSKVENPNYLFIDLIISSGCTPGKIPIKLQAGTKDVLSFDYPLHARELSSSEREGFNSTDAIYLITPDRFANGDTLNDNLPDMQDKVNRPEAFGRHGGDIEGVTQQLGYISEMGFTGIWLNPVLENKMPRHSYHGYAITDFYHVDPRFGTNESYKNFCSEASKKNIKVIMDMVVNHCGLSHWWMNDLPSRDWINYHDRPYKQTNHRKTINSDPYAAEEDAIILSQGWFVPTMPDLNILNPYLGKYMIQNSIWWIEYAGLSGIRMDTYPYPDEDYMSEWASRIMEEYPGFNIAGEVWYDDPAIIAYWQNGKKNNNGYVSHLPALFDFPLQTSLTKSLMTPTRWDDGWLFLYETLAKDFQYADPHQLVVFADNHDMSRIYTQLDENEAKLKMALSFILTMRGIPQIYYGTEILMFNRGTDSHGVIRSDFPGGWKGDTVNAFTGAGLSEQQIRIKKFLQQLLIWRKDADVIHHGKTRHYVPENNVYVFFRYDNRKTVMVVLNKNEQPVSLNLDRFRSMLPTAVTARDIFNGKEMLMERELQLTEAGPLIIEIDK